MRLIINGKEYDGSAQPFIGDLRLLKPAFGFGFGEVVRRLEVMDGEVKVAELLDDDKFAEALIAWMWMSRLRAGERDLTVDEVWMTPLDGFRMVDDAPQQAPAEPSSELAATGGDGEGPTAAPTDSGRGESGGELVEVPTGPSTTTSLPPSTSGSL